MCLSTKKDKILSQCLSLATDSDMLFQHGCIATLGGKIVARGNNTNKNYTKNDTFLKNRCTCHAEVNVLRQIYHKLRRNNKDYKMNRTMKKLTLYISRHKSSSIHKCEHGNSAPCQQCLELINQFNVRKIIFYMDNEFHEINPKDYVNSHKSFGQLYVERIQ